MHIHIITWAWTTEKIPHSAKVSFSRSCLQGTNFEPYNTWVWMTKVSAIWFHRNTKKRESVCVPYAILLASYCKWIRQTSSRTNKKVCKMPPARRLLCSTLICAILMRCTFIYGTKRMSQIQKKKKHISIISALSSSFFTF